MPDAGGMHHMLFHGPLGAGKTMLWHRCPNGAGHRRGGRVISSSARLS
jgi:tRNA A37 threonylcarbamoyladenosine biosynthesis protein TsaE